MAFTIGSGTFTNGSATVTGVTLTSGTLAYFASGTRMAVGVNPVVQEVEAIAAPTVSTITLRSAWTGTGGTYSFLANQTSEGLRDAVQAIRTNNASLQSFIDSIDTAATADSVAQRTSDGSINAVNVYASGNVGVGTSNPLTKLDVHNGAIRKVNSNGVMVLANGNTAGGVKIGAYNAASNADGYLVFEGYTKEYMRIDSSGNVGIGTSSPSEKLSVDGNIWQGNGGGVEIGKIFNNAGWYDFAASSNVVGAQLSHAATVRFLTNSTERLRIDSSGNVGIGTSSPGAKIDAVTAGGFCVGRFGNGATQLNVGVSSDNTTFLEVPQAQPLRFITNSTERMRIDASGNVLVGGVGAIRPVGIRLAIASDNGSSGSGLLFDTGSTLPTNRLSALTDNQFSLGSATYRWNTVYAGTGTINTSDAREKTPVDEFTAEELNAAKQLSKEIGTYKFLSAVAKKGDDARKHIGMTVQRAIEIMEANNLDPFAYGFICYDAWEEKTVDHPAVEAVEGKEAWTETIEHEAEYDEDGEVIKEAWIETIEHEAVEAVEAKDAYTEVTQEAGDRYSFRPDEMLFFIARGLEARIEALEG